MQLVERHVITRADRRFAAIDRAAFASKNLYNAANYALRQSYIFQGVYLSYPDMHQRMKDHEAYQALPAKVAQQVLRVLDKYWHSFLSTPPARQRSCASSYRVPARPAAPPSQARPGTPRGPSCAGASQDNSGTRPRR